MNFVLPAGLAVPDGNGFEHREAVERLEPFLAAVAACAHATKRQLDPAPRPVVIHEHLPAPKRPRQSQLPCAIARPDPGHQSVGGTVGEPNRMRFVIKGHGHQHRAEDFLLGKGMVGRDVAKQNRLLVKPG